MVHLNAHFLLFSVAVLKRIFVMHLAVLCLRFLILLLAVTFSFTLQHIIPD